jgi:hypothetical protein
MLIVPISAFFMQKESYIEAELLTGMLAGSSILLAFQFTLLAKALDNPNRWDLGILSWVLIIGFVTVLVGTFLMFYNAVGVIPRIFALCALVFSFEINFLFVILFCWNLLSLIRKRKKI